MQGIYKLPAFVLASVAIAAGIAFIVFNDRPVHVCDPQIARFNYATQRLGNMQALLKQCRESHSPGGCYPVFSYLRRALKNLPLVSAECAEPLKQQTQIKSILINGLEIMPLLAFRPEALSGKRDKLNWLGFADMSLWCKLRDRLLVLFGKAPLAAAESRTVLQIIKNLEMSHERSYKRKYKKAKCPDTYPICDINEEEWQREYQKPRPLSPSEVQKKSLFSENCARWR